MNIKRLSISTLMSAAAVYAIACTSLIAAPGATTTGGAMITYAADSHTLYGALYHQDAADHAAGAMRSVDDWDSGEHHGMIPQPAHTYATVGNMNEHGLAIGESTFYCRPEVEGSGTVDYGSLIYITLQRARTAREAVKVMTDLVAEHGYASGGESFSIADPSEAWIMEMVGKGKDDPGALWVARRVPDGYICGHANHSRIHRFPLNDPETLYSPDVISYAREKGWYNAADEDFDFSRTYAVTDAGALRGCDARVWAYFNRYGEPGAMDAYIPWIMEGRGEPMPLWVKPAAPLSANDMKAMMRDHFEGTHLDMTKDIGAGPFEVPYRWRPMEYTVDGNTYTHERAIATQQTGFSFVADLDKTRHDAMKGILWFGVDDANTCVYVPVFCSNNRVPVALSPDTADLYTLSWDSMFWVNNYVANQAYNRYSQMIGDIRDVQSALEDSADALVASMTEQVTGKPYADAQALLTDATDTFTTDATARYQQLGDYLFVKYLDGNIKKEKDGAFERNAAGVPVQPVFGGYN
ncbi:MAG: C69 family dipeptidase, partial [Muribaculaceae bacterium]|nr:C69 family dipeptidase [Muribaculaceae bacterium]